MQLIDVLLHVSMSGVSGNWSLPGERSLTGGPSVSRRGWELGIVSDGQLSNSGRQFLDLTGQGLSSAGMFHHIST